MLPIQPAVSITSAASIVTTSAQRRRISPLEIPELFIKIFSFEDFRTLAHAVILVCRRWFLINNEVLIQNRGIYFDEDEHNLARLNSALLGLPWASWLGWHTIGISIRQLVQRRALVKVLQAKHEQYQKTLLQELYQPIDATPIAATDAASNTAAAIFSPQDDAPISLLDVRALERLRSGLVMPLLELDIRDKDIDLDHLFDAMPRLQNLALMILGTLTISVPEPPKPVKVEKKNTTLFSPPPLLLRSLTLEQCRIPQEMLESILARAVHLQELRLVKLLSTTPRFAPHAHVHYDTPQFFALLQQLGLPLRVLHVPFMEVDVPDVLQSALDAEASRMMNPADLEIDTFMIRTVGPQLQNTITTLDLRGSKPCWGLRPNMDLLLGFCLRTLRVGLEYRSVTYKQAKFNWMVKSGHGERERLSRRLKVEGWKTLYEYEAEEKERLGDAETVVVAQNPGEGDDSDRLLKEALRELGLIVDVKKVLEEMDSTEDYQCWPEIRRASIFSGNPFGFPLEREHQRMDTDC
ncbi:hypothetical protein BGX23_008591 [Mortierella sp. AD031]|nr:hypothetical protein BGX23_008591 [Mortierella sp. AD031]